MFTKQMKKQFRDVGSQKLLLHSHANHRRLPCHPAKEAIGVGSAEVGRQEERNSIFPVGPC